MARHAHFFLRESDSMCRVMSRPVANRVSAHGQNTTGCVLLSSRSLIHPVLIDCAASAIVRLSKAVDSSETGFFSIHVPAISEESSRHADEGDAAHDWLCAWCLNRVANDKDRIAHSGDTEMTFKNPEGQRFHILLFSRTTNCRDVGTPTLEHTWFPGYAWSYCICSQCRSQLGWFYSGPTSFAGLIRDRIVRRLHIVN